MNDDTDRINIDAARGMDADTYCDNTMEALRGGGFPDIYISMVDDVMRPYFRKVDAEKHRIVALRNGEDRDEQIDRLMQATEALISTMITGVLYQFIQDTNIEDASDYAAYMVTRIGELVYNNIAATHAASGGAPSPTTH